jgi:type IV secretion system protein TrbL
VPEVKPDIQTGEFPVVYTPVGKKLVEVGSDCFSCQAITSYSDYAKSFTNDLAVALHDASSILFIAIAGLWIVTSGVKLVLEQTSFRDIAKEFIFISITGLILGAQDKALISEVFDIVIKIMGSSAAEIFKICSGTENVGDYKGLAALAFSGEKAVGRVFEVSQAIMLAGGMTSPGTIINGVLLCIPYFILIANYSSQVIVAIFRAMIVGILAPFLFLAFAFNFGRPMAMRGLQTILATILVLFTATATLAMIIMAVTSNEVVKKMTSIGTDDAVIKEFASISNPQFLMMLFLGWAGCALMKEGTSIANSIAQTALSNESASTMARGAGLSTMAAVGVGSNSVKSLFAKSGLGKIGAAALGAGATYMNGGPLPSWNKGVESVIKKFNGANDDKKND